MLSCPPVSTPPECVRPMERASLKCSWDIMEHFCTFLWSNNPTFVRGSGHREWAEQFVQQSLTQIIKKKYCVFLWQCSFNSFAPELSAADLSPVQSPCSRLHSPEWSEIVWQLSGHSHSTHIFNLSLQQFPVPICFKETSIFQSPGKVKWPVSMTITQ